MTSRTNIILFTRDPELLQRLTGFLSGRVQLRHVENYADLERRSGQAGPSVILADLRARECADHVSDLLAARPQNVVIAIGEPRSEPMLEAELAGAFACEDVNADRMRMQALVARARTFLETILENEMLREETAMLSAREDRLAPARESARLSPRLQLRHLSHALRKLEKIDALFETVVENIAAAASVSRAGLFVRTRESDVLRLRAGLRCLDETTHLEYTPRDDLVRWLAVHDHLISRATLGHTKSPAERQMLKQSLDAMGAEVILPLHARGQSLGWLFIGHRGTGLPFDVADLEDLSVLSDHVSTVLENALLYEEVAVQKTLAETLLHSMPTGIVAVGLNGVVRWFNTAAQHILDASPNKVLNNPLRTLGSRLADALQRTLDGSPTEKPLEWLDGLTKRYLSVQTHRLMNGDVCLGAVALVHDKTVEILLDEKKDQLERAVFWTELAASMSHEIRNPLVAIKTFAQLLPERFDDPEFRADFSKHVTSEVDRLNSIIEQINQFAHPPPIKAEPVNIKDTVLRGLKLAHQRHEPNGTAIENWTPDHMPVILGDGDALAESICHVITNALEATEGRTGGRIEITAKELDTSDIKRGVIITVRDNGRGIPADARDKVFSPFYTTKARGMGLGLPIVKRTVVDHSGRVHIDSGDQGTTVSIMLPGGQKAEKNEVKHEEHISR